MDNPYLQDLSGEMFGICINEHMPAGSRIRLHEHPHYELIYMLKGARKVRLDGKTWTAHGGDLLVYRPGEPHEESVPTRRSTFIYIRLRPEQLAVLGADLPSAAQLPPVIRLPWKERFLELFGRLHAETRAPGDESSLLIGAYLVEFAVLLRRAVADRARQATTADAIAIRRIESAVQLVQSGMAGTARLTDMARSAFMSVSHFSHKFKELTGKPPKRFLIQDRISRAKELLRGTDRSAAAIAETLGYESASFFYRQFKKETGLTPLQFRAGHAPAKK